MEGVWSPQLMYFKRCGSHIYEFLENNVKMNNEYNNHSFSSIKIIIFNIKKENIKHSHLFTWKNILQNHIKGDVYHVNGNINDIML